MTNLEHALSYRKRGWSIIPIQKGSKLPAIKSWTKYQTELPTEAEIRSWFMVWEDAGIALICGKVSGVIAVDIDSGKGEVDTKGLEMPPTLAQKTGTGGSHLLYVWRPGLVGAKVGIRKGLDIRSDNSYIILAPSIHPNGNAYEWIDEDESIADAPSWLEERPHENSHATDWDKFFTEKKGKGIRNMSATQLAGKIMYEMSAEMWEPLGYPIFQKWNDEHNDPKLPEEELRTIWKSIAKTHLKNNAPKEDGETDPEEKELTPEEEAKEIVKIFKKNKAKATYYLAKWMTRKYNIITVGEKEREMFVYEDGIYFQAENQIIFPEIQNVLTDEVTKSAKLETFHKIADMTSKPRSIFETAKLNFIPLANGVYDMDTNVLLPHSPEFKFKYKFPVQYDGKAQCPKTLAFFDQIFTEEQLLIAQEWIGYYFYRSYMFKKAIIFVGETDTGKTTFLETIINLIGTENRSSVPLQKLSSDKFSAAHLYEKHGNIVDELSVKDISDTGNFKVATGGGSITGEYKFGNQFSFYNFSKFTFACNRIPDVADFDDVAYFNRWIIVRFESTITNKIPDFFRTLTTEEERAGLFNWSMDGLRRLLAQKGFSYTKDPDDIKIEMMRSSSSAGNFIARMVMQQIGAEITKEDMYDAYVAYCEENELAVVTKKAFGMKFVTLKYVSEGLIYGSSGKRVEGWRGVAIIKSDVQKKKDIVQEVEFKDF